MGEATGSDIASQDVLRFFESGGEGGGPIVPIEGGEIGHGNGIAEARGHGWETAAREEIIERERDEAEVGAERGQLTYAGLQGGRPDSRIDEISLWSDPKNRVAVS